VGDVGARALPKFRQPNLSGAGDRIVPRRRSRPPVPKPAPYDDGRRTQTCRSPQVGRASVVPLVLKLADAFWLVLHRRPVKSPADQGQAGPWRARSCSEVVDAPLRIQRPSPTLRQQRVLAHLLHRPSAGVPKHQPRGTRGVRCSRRSYLLAFSSVFLPS
jgi:hypothetical protein